MSKNLAESWNKQSREEWCHLAEVWDKQWRDEWWEPLNALQD